MAGRFIMSTQRALRGSQSIKRELSDMNMGDLKNERIKGLASITDVECTSDCRSVRVFISVFGNEEEQKSTMEALNEKVGFIRGELCRRLQLRFAPEMHLTLDDSLERGAKFST